ncbi:hypothetical protein [Marinagarivorans algicola]|uniref:hypothetical protein n=1 Tax=Marinagarivorans algicola TaxID=1513270 RepID=UPI0006B9B6BD|nr:hypothetical protein [Marinagarivorans algicola]
MLLSLDQTGDSTAYMYKLGNYTHGAGMKSRCFLDAQPLISHLNTQKHSISTLQIQFGSLAE